MSPVKFVQQGSVAIERSVGRGVAMSATYLMNLDRQLPNSVNINIAPSTVTKIYQLSGGTEHLFLTRSGRRANAGPVGFLLGG